MFVFVIGVVLENKVIWLVFIFWFNGLFIFIKEVISLFIGLLFFFIKKEKFKVLFYIFILYYLIISIYLIKFGEYNYMYIYFK